MNGSPCAGSAAEWLLIRVGCDVEWVRGSLTLPRPTVAAEALVCTSTVIVRTAEICRRDRQDGV